MSTPTDEQYRCVLCDGKAFGSKEELDKHNQEGTRYKFYLMNLTVIALDVTC